MHPKVTIICLCYNHEPYLNEALRSVKSQTYAHLQVILVDDGSSDNSRILLQQYLDENPHWSGLLSSKNEGNCKAFNKALALAEGKYIVDFATDDVLVPDRVEKQVSFFENQAEDVGVIYSNALLIDKNGAPLKTYYAPGSYQPEGDLFAALLKKTFICAPTMMMRASILQAIDGYNESLAYEDYDFWVRSSRVCLYAYHDDVTIHHRKTENGLSSAFYDHRKVSTQSSTANVLDWAEKKIRTENERGALIKAIRFYFRFSVFSGAFSVSDRLWSMLRKHRSVSALESFVYLLRLMRIPLSSLYGLRISLKK